MELDSSRLGRRTPEVWGKVPPRNKNFTGREALLQQLHRSISTVTAGVPLPQALQGFGGVGKTQLAIEYAWRYRDSYQVVWWIAADQAFLIPSALAALAPHLGVPLAESAGVEDVADAVLEALRQGEPYKNWLLVFDNADQPESVRKYIPLGDHGHVIITSRNSRWDAVAQTVEVNVFERAESIAFLTKRVPGIKASDADRLADALGDLPLALEQAGALQAESGISVDDYLEMLAESTREVLSLSKSTEYPLSMMAAWRLSVTQVEQRSPEAAKVLRCCAFFGPEPIPRDVFRRGVTTPPRLVEILSKPVVLTKAIGDLNRFALVRVNPESRTIQVHRLVQALLRDDLPPKEQEELRHEVHLLLANYAPKDPDDTASWSRFAGLIAHLEPTKVADSTEPAVRELAINAVRYLYLQGNYRSARELAQNLMRTWSGQSGERHVDVLRVRRHLGTILWQLGEFSESERINEETLRAMREVLGPEHEETLRVLNTYCANLRAKGDFHAALREELESRIAHEKVFGPTHAQTLRSINNLAIDYALVGEYTRARELQELAYLEQIGGAEGVSRWDIATSLSSLSRVVRLCGDLIDAHELAVEAYDYSRVMLSPEHHLTLRAAKELSIVKRRLGAFDEALEIAEDTYRRLRRYFGPDHPDTLAAATNVANTLRHMGDLERAHPLTSDTGKRCADVYGSRHPYTLSCTANLALLERLRGNVAQAREMNQEVREAFTEVIGPEDNYTLLCELNLAGDLAALDEHVAAVELERRVLRLMRLRFGEEHYMPFAAAANLLLDLRAMGEEQEADRIHAELSALLGNTAEPDHRRDMLSGVRIDFDFDPAPL